ncbi:aldehyde dehydrogenase family protein, partial [Paraburkholderia sp. J11-2]|uniref:aldehyde dehydrogenase family protein n=1 Tax=Paraburkholderia sp. J11-2 TaxID=2805431 RepID=UPI002AB75EF3
MPSALTLALSPKGALDARFRHFGQAPVCANRLFVHEDVYEKFDSRLASKATALHIGNGFADGVHIVSLISDSAVVHIEELVKQAVLSGAKGALRLASRSTYFRPTVLTAVDQ